MIASPSSPARADLAVIFAGGKARRMGGVDKAALEIGGRPLWSLVLTRLAPQARRIAVAAPAAPGWLTASGLDFVADANVGAGPAAALLGALEAAASEGPETLLLTSPVDAPLLPLDLIDQLKPALGEADAAIVVAGDGLHPVFGLWRAGCAGRVRELVTRGELALHRIAQALGAVECRKWEGQIPDPFMNINTPDDLSAAHAVLSS